ncbi:MAG: GWxTD domain-containing protein [Candidatus Aminicenantes bacterium]|nr:MAG: GWxTD domain-containing protein [Candidatus Aminicenantes bacterium]
MINKSLRVLLIFLVVGSLLLSGQRIREKDLSAKYQDWLKLVSYIIQPEEKDVFLQLANDRERDIFIEAFWRQRDPTPGTPQNENKDEHTRRFIHANQRYGRSTPREGWMTDMGRIYIILGEPLSTEMFEVSGIYPAEVWTYNGDRTKGLPTQFNLVFFQRSGAGEYKLYNPTSDGPAALIIDKQGLDLSDHRTLYNKILELAPTLAGPSISLIPGQYPYNYTPSPRSNIVIASIFESPKKDISPNYATHFLNYKGVVSTDYLTNYVESHTDVALIQDPILSFNFLHFSISPSSVSIDYFEPNDQYYCNYQLNVGVKKSGELIFQYSKDFPFYFEPENVDIIKGKGIAIQDSFPLIEGTYQLNILIQNSVGKEFSVFEGGVVIPEHTGDPKIIGPVVGYGLQDYPAHLHVPFKVVDKQLLVDPASTISRGDKVAFFFSIMNMTEDLWKGGKVDVFLGGLKEKDPSRITFTLPLKEYPFHKIIGINHALSADDLSPDYYELKLVLKDGEGIPLHEKKSNIIVSPSESIPHPVTLAKSFPLSNYFLYLYSLANQYDRADNPEKAESHYEKAFSLNPSYHPGTIEYCHFLLKIKRFQKSLDLIEYVKDSEDLRFEYFLVKGKAFMGLEKYFAAVESFLEGNKIYNSDIRILNSLGYCFYKTGDKQSALETLRASLRLSPDQQEIRALIQEIEKE